METLKKLTIREIAIELSKTYFTRSISEDIFSVISTETDIVKIANKYDLHFVINNYCLDNSNMLCMANFMLFENRK